MDEECCESAEKDDVTGAWCSDAGHKQKDWNGVDAMNWSAQRDAQLCDL